MTRSQSNSEVWPSRPELDGRRNMPQYRRDALTLIRSRLDTSDPGFNGSADIRAALDDARSYLQAWVFPMIDLAAGIESEAMRRDARAEAAAVNSARIAEGQTP